MEEEARAEFEEALTNARQGKAHLLKAKEILDKVDANKSIDPRVRRRANHFSRLLETSGNDAEFVIRGLDEDLNPHLARY
jgi:hypothetical protein